MHRIDTINARPHQNGIGKAGFNDNTDLAGQDATYLDPAHLNAIQEEIASVIEYRALLEKGNNHQLRDVLFTTFATHLSVSEVDVRLSTAITALGAIMQQAIINERNAERNRIWPVGRGRYTTYDGLNPADAGHLGWGTWVLDTATSGRVAIGKGTTIDERGEELTFEIGDRRGEFKHVQTEGEMRRHNHTSDPRFNKISAHFLDVEHDAIFNAQTTNAINRAGNDELVVGTNGTGTAAFMAAATMRDVGNGDPMTITQPYYVVSIWVRTG